MSLDKDKDRMLAERSRLGYRAWDSGRKGTLNLGRNAAKRARRKAKKGRG